MEVGTAVELAEKFEQRPRAEGVDATGEVTEEVALSGMGALTRIWL